MLLGRRSGERVLGTRKVGNVRAGRRKVALVVDDLPSLDPFVARGIRVYGEADGPVERVGMMGPGLYLRIVPSVSWSWNMAGEPVGETWYNETRRPRRLRQGSQRPEVTPSTPFPGGPGRTTNPTDFTSLMDDLEERIFGRLDDDTWFYPGHGKDSTLGAERPQIPEWRARGW